MLRFIALTCIYVAALNFTLNMNKVSGAERIVDPNLPEGVQLVATFQKQAPQSVATDSKRNVFVAGYMPYSATMSKTSQNTVGIFLNKYDELGNRKWEATYGLDDGDSSAREVVLDRNGNAFIIGDSGGIFGHNARNRPQCYIAKFDQDGQRSWVNRFGPTNGELCFAFTGAVDKEGNLFAVGFGSLKPKTDKDSFNFYSLIKYTTSGEIAWQQ